MKARIWKFLHNVIAHPLMEVLPAHWGAILHDATAMKAFGHNEKPLKENRPTPNG